MTSELHRCVSAAIRARLAVNRTSGNTLAKQIGKSQNYVASRLRDEAAFTLDDIEKIVRQLGEDEGAASFIAEAVTEHGERIMIEERERARAEALAKEREADRETRAMIYQLQQDRILIEEAERQARLEEATPDFSRMAAQMNSDPIEEDNLYT